MAKKEKHSEDFFNTHRDHWWDRDFLELMARRWNLASAQSVLDVGCGLGHWGRVLAAVLPEKCKVTGIDRETEWVKKATEKVKEQGLANRFDYNIERVRRSASIFILRA